MWHDLDVDMLTLLTSYNLRPVFIYTCSRQTIASHVPTTLPTFFLNTTARLKRETDQVIFAKLWTWKRKMSQLPLARRAT